MRESGQSWIQIQPQGITAVGVRPRILLRESSRIGIIVSRPEVVRPTLGIEILSCIAESIPVQRIGILLHPVGVIGVAPRQSADEADHVAVRVVQIRLPGGVAHQYYSLFLMYFFVPIIYPIDQKQDINNAERKENAAAQLPDE